MNPLFSVIISCYNFGRYLPECIESVLEQAYQRLEIIIVDDGSTDKQTISYLRSLNNEKIRVHYQTNLGVSVARNVGATLAKGEYLLFLDGDDKIDPNYFSLAVNLLNKIQDLDYIYCDLEEFDGGKTYRTLGELKLNDVLLHAVTHVSGIISKDLWAKSGGFDEDFINGWEDWDFLIRITFLNIKYFKINGAMLKYRIRNNSRDKLANEKHMQELEQLIFKKNISNYLLIYKKPISILRELEDRKRIINDLEEKVLNSYNTFSYRLGSFLLFPIKYISKKIG